MLEFGALLLLAHAVAHTAPIALAGRRVQLEVGLEARGDIGGGGPGWLRRAAHVGRLN